METTRVRIPQQVRQMDIKDGTIRYVDINKSVFLKTFNEKLKLKRIISAHKKKLRDVGYNPKKQLNIPGEILS